MTPERTIPENFTVQGCPVADGKHSCVVTCGGNWPGTKITTEKMTASVIAQKINPDRLGCGPLQERARNGLEKLRQNGQSKK